MVACAHCGRFCVVRAQGCQLFLFGAALLLPHARCTDEPSKELALPHGREQQRARPTPDTRCLPPAPRGGPPRCPESPGRIPGDVTDVSAAVVRAQRSCGGCLSLCLFSFCEEAYEMVDCVALSLGASACVQIRAWLQCKSAEEFERNVFF